MMIRLLSITVSLLLLISCSSEKYYEHTNPVTEIFAEVVLSNESLLYTDRSGSSMNGHFTTHHENGSLHADIHFDDGLIKNGSVYNDEGILGYTYALQNGLIEFTSYHQDGTPAFRTLQENNVSGIIEAYSWYENGAPLSESTLTHFKTWHENGELASEIPKIDGKADGVGYAWHANGQLSNENHFREDQWHGSFRMWDEEGNLISEKFYEMGMPDSVHKTWDSMGNLIEEKMYKDGKPHGSHKMWDTTGTLISENHFDDGNLIHPEN